MALHVPKGSLAFTFTNGPGGSTGPGPLVYFSEDGEFIGISTALIAGEEAAQLDNGDFMTQANRAWKECSITEITSGPRSIFGHASDSVDRFWGIANDALLGGGGFRLWSNAADG